MTSPRPALSDSRQRLRIDCGPVLVLAVVFLFTARGYIQVSDTTFSLSTAEALLDRGSLAIPAADSGSVGATLQGPDGRSYSKYGIGLALIFVPLIAVARWVALLPVLSNLPAARLTDFVASFVNVPFAVLTVALFLRLLREFGVDARDRLWLVVALGIGTLCWRYAGHDFSEVVQMALLMLAALGVVMGTPRAIGVAGSSFGALLSVKIVHAAVLPLFLAYLCCPQSQAEWQQWIKRLVLFVLPIAIAFGLLGWLNFVRFGDVLETGYSSDASAFHPVQLVETVPKLLTSLEKGLFVFSPVLLLGLVGFPAFCRHYPREAALFAGVVIVEMLLAGAFLSWRGGWEWGPRYLVPSIPFWLVPAAFITRAWSVSSARRWADRSVRLVIMLSVIFQVPGVLVKEQQIHHIKVNMLTATEQAQAAPDFVTAFQLLRHKLTSDDEIYRVSEFGVPGERELDLSRIETFQGIDVWTEHLAHQVGQPVLRWLPLVGFVVTAIAIRKAKRKGGKRARH